jgi:hypothetical protein
VYSEFVKEHYFEGYRDISCLRDIGQEVRLRFGDELAEGVSWKNAFEKLIQLYSL